MHLRRECWYGCCKCVSGFVACAVLKFVHFLHRHALPFTPGPPKHFMLRHSGHVPQFGCWHPVHSPQRPLDRFRLNLTVVNKLDSCMCVFMTIECMKIIRLTIWVTNHLVVSTVEGWPSSGGFGSCWKIVWITAYTSILMNECVILYLALVSSFFPHSVMVARI